MGRHSWYRIDDRPHRIQTHDELVTFSKRLQDLLEDDARIILKPTISEHDGLHQAVVRQRDVGHRRRRGCRRVGTHLAPHLRFLGFDFLDVFGRAQPPIPTLISGVVLF